MLTYVPIHSAGIEARVVLGGWRGGTGCCAEGEPTSSGTVLLSPLTLKSLVTGALTPTLRSLSTTRSCFFVVVHFVFDMFSVLLLVVLLRLVPDGN